MAEPAERRTLRAAEYLAFERASEVRHELVDGEIFAMTGASRAHNLVVGNLHRLLGNALLDRPCDVFVADMRVRVSESRYCYPDLAVRCDGSAFEDEHEDTLLDPAMIAAVLSDSTEAYDRGEKFEGYRGLASLREYLLVSQKKALVEQYVRMPDGSWRLTQHGPGDSFTLESVGVEVAVDEVYRRVFG